MLLFKSCPKCRGDMHVNRDIYGDYKQCLQCGMMVDLVKEGGRLMVTTSTGSKKKRVA